jgi:branched-chain amino acid transport system permease protein
MSSELAEILISGLSNAAVYALLAMGMALVYGVSRVFNLAYGSFYTLAGYLAWLLFERGLGYPLVIPLVLVSFFVLGSITDRVLVRPIRRQKNWETLVIICLLGLSIAITAFELVVFGPMTKQVPPLLSGTTRLGAVAISNQSIVIIVAVVVTVAALLLFLKKTRTGLAVQAVAQDPEGAEVVGIRHNTVFNYTFAIATVLAAIAAILLAPRYFVSYNYGFDILIKAWVITTVGGMGSMAGAVIAAVLLAMVEAFVSWQLGPTMVTFVWFSLLFILFIFRPQGLLGRWA